MLLRTVGLVLWMAAWGGSSVADEIHFGFRPMPPYVMVDEAGTYSGLEYELVVAALGAAGHTVKPHGYPFARLFETLKARKVQGAAPVLPVHDIGRARLTDPFITYQNVAMTLERSGLKLKQISDLKGHSIMAFQTATLVLGPEYAAAVKGNPHYSEMASQVLQIRTLFAGRVEVAVGESRILNHFIHAPETGVEASLPVTESRLFPPTRYRAAFLDPRHAEDFNRGLKAIRTNGTLQKILRKYATAGSAGP